mmetsp:Transcript_61780/g.135121  ORF Transcript_61780/g.135121 Transcript_61780/m.135121 type:complete len:202 (-) Transcript_61780:840-1445(-)
MALLKKGVEVPVRCADPARTNFQIRALLSLSDLRLLRPQHTQVHILSVFSGVVAFLGFPDPFPIGWCLNRAGRRGETERWRRRCVSVAAEICYRFMLLMLLLLLLLQALGQIPAIQRARVLLHLGPGHAIRLPPVLRRQQCWLLTARGPLGAQASSGNPLKPSSPSPRKGPNQQTRLPPQLQLRPRLRPPLRLPPFLAKAM